jgi:uncharacterized protein (TIRG00374 family)
VTVVLLVYVFYKAGVFSEGGRLELSQMLADASMPLILASLGVGVLILLSNSVKWYMLVRASGFEISLWRIMAYCEVGKFFNLVLPTSIGGDVMRMQVLGQFSGRHADAVASVFVERFSGIVTLLALAMLALVANFSTLNVPWLTSGLAVLAAAVVLLYVAIVDDRVFRQARRLFEARSPILQNLFGKAERVRDAVLAYKDNRRALVGAIINSLIFNFLVVVNVWVSALAFGSKIGFLTILLLVPVVLFIMNLPISIGGLGLMEFALSFTFGLVGGSAQLALSTALLIRAKNLLDAAAGGVLYAVLHQGWSIKEMLGSTTGE